MTARSLSASLLVVASILVLGPAATAAEYTVDPDHTRVGFKVKHMMINWVHGTFTGGIEGKIEFDPDDLSTFSADVSVDTSTIDTGVDRRDGHLSSADFLAVKEHPAMRFVSTGVRNIEKNEFELVGDLTIRGVTREVVFDVDGPLGPAKDMSGKMVYGFHGVAVIDRMEYGVDWNRDLETGGVVVGEEVHIQIDLELVAGA